MSEVSHNHELARRLAVLEERMKTMDERYDKGWALLREDMAKRDAEAAKRDAKRDAEAARRDVEAAKRDAKRDAEAARRDVEAAKRDKDNLRWQIGLWVAAVVIIGVILRWPVLPVASGS